MRNSPSFRSFTQATLSDTRHLHIVVYMTITGGFPIYLLNHVRFRPLS
jgi:hypothetical protein